MNERWVCKRCFTSNGGDTGVCSNCGLARGSEVPADEVAVPAAGGVRPASRWSWLLRFWWIGLVIVVAVGGAIFAARRDEGGQIVGAGDLQVFDLQPGDCFDLKDPTDEEVDDVEAKPCTEPHEFEMFLSTSLPDGEYPDETTFVGYLERECLPAFAEFVGTSYEQSRLDIYWLTPTEPGWAAGDREMQCAVFDPIDEELTESLRSSER
jgi:hypothetical protein